MTLLRNTVTFFKDNKKVSPEDFEIEMIKQSWMQDKGEDRKAAAIAAELASNEDLDNMSDLSDSEGIVGAPPMRLAPAVRQGTNYFSQLRAGALRLGIITTSSVVNLRKRLFSLIKPKEEQVLLEFLPKHLLIECEGDGACLFNGIDGLLTGEFNGERMRKICLQAFKKDPQKYRKYLDLHHDASECPGILNICKQEGKTHTGKILKSLEEPCFIMVHSETEYINEMSKPSTYGTNFEMHLLADKLQMELMIITKNEAGRGNPLYYNHYRPSTKSAKVLSQLVLYSENLHFEPVIVEMEEKYDEDQEGEVEEEEPIFPQLSQQKGKKAMEVEGCDTKKNVNLHRGIEGGSSVQKRLTKTVLKKRSFKLKKLVSLIPELTNEELKRPAKQILENPTEKHPVQLLNELRGGITYEVTEDSNSIFTITCNIEGTAYSGRGRSKKEAKKQAAIRALDAVYNIKF